MDKPLVSICIPIYNGEATIKKTLESVLQQTYDNIEIVIVDNCSTDHSVEIIQSIASSKIFLHRNETNLGMAGNWNRCMELAKGQYIHFVCADDIIVPTCIEEKMKCALRNADICMVFSASVITNADGELVMNRHPFRKNCLIDGQKLARRSYYTKNIYGEPSNVLFRADAIQKVGNFAKNTCYSTDWDLWLRISCLGTVGYVNRELMQYRISSGNETSSLNIHKQIQDDTVLMKNMKAYACMKLTVFDNIIHHGMVMARTVARFLFMKWKV